MDTLIRAHATPKLLTDRYLLCGGISSVFRGSAALEHTFTILPHPSTPPTHPPPHTPLPTDRYLLYGDISAQAAAELRKPEVADHFARLIQRVAPKSYAQVRWCACSLFRSGFFW